LAVAWRRWGAAAGARGRTAPPPLRRGVANDDHAPALAVAAARREARLIEDLRQHLVGQRIGRKFPRRESRPQYLVQLHGSPRSPEWGAAPIDLAVVSGLALRSR